MTTVLEINNAFFFLVFPILPTPIIIIHEKASLINNLKTFLNKHYYCLKTSSNDFLSKDSKIPPSVQLTIFICFNFEYFSK